MPSFYFKGKAQDLHYSQFYNSPLNTNPALIGIFNGDQRFNLSYRNQWKFVPVTWTTFSLAYDRKYYLEDDKHFFRFWGNLNYDRQGDSKLTLTGINVGASYTRKLTKPPHWRRCHLAFQPVPSIPPISPGINNGMESLLIPTLQVVKISIFKGSTCWKLHWVSTTDTNRAAEPLLMPA